MTAIKRIYVRHYSDNGQITAYVDWADGSRTEAQPIRYPARQFIQFAFGHHMHALFARANRQGLKLERETW